MKREKNEKILITLLLLLLCYSIIGTYNYNDGNASCVFDSSDTCTISENTFVYDPNIPEETKTRIIYNGGDNNYTELDRKWVTTYTFMDYAQEHARIDYVVAPREDMRFHADGSTFTLTSETIHYSESSYHTGMRIEHEIMTRANANANLFDASVAWREKMKRLDSDGYTFVTDYSYQTKGSTSQTC